MMLHSSAAADLTAVDEGGAATRPAVAAAPARADLELRRAREPRDFSLQVAELAVLLLAIIGAVAVGLGITAYFSFHPYVVAYLLAYTGFRVADVLVRDSPRPAREWRINGRLMRDLALLGLFFAAPFERTFLYGGETPRWLSALGLLLELGGIWLVLGARIQRWFFSSDNSDDVIVRRGIFSYIRHPVYAGESLVMLAWPFEYGAPITLVVALIVRLGFVVRRIRREEADLMAQYGDEYAAYVRTTDRLIPNLW